MKILEKMTGGKQLTALFLIYRSLIICLIILGVVLICGTIYGAILHVNRQSNSKVVASNNVGQGQTFTGIGPIRVSTADPHPGMVILFVTFIFYPEDKAFSEELVLRVKDFRQIIMEYFGSFAVSELRVSNEESMKTQLLDRFNAILRLGQIDTIYFSEFMIVE